MAQSKQFLVVSQLISLSENDVCHSVAHTTYNTRTYIVQE